jgi:hypothetical protein
VAHAVVRVAKTALGHPALLVLAAAAFVALAVFTVPFPVVIAVAAGIGWGLGRWVPETMRTAGGNGTGNDGPAARRDAADGDRCPVPLGQAAPPSDRRAVLARRVRLLVAATITYNVIEAAVALTAGVRASSTALIGFGLDSVIEVSSAAALAWQFAGRDPEARERIALRAIATSFFALAAYISVDALRTLLGAGQAEHSRPVWS